jgi:hypothetical protein
MLSDEQFELFFKNCAILAKIQNCAHELCYPRIGPISSDFFLEVIGIDSYTKNVCNFTT